MAADDREAVQWVETTKFWITQTIFGPRITTTAETDNLSLISHQEPQREERDTRV